MRRPYLNGTRDVLLCPECKAIIWNRRSKSCPRCKVGLKFSGEFVFEGDYFWDSHNWIKYDDLIKKVKKVKNNTT